MQGTDPTNLIRIARENGGTAVVEPLNLGRTGAEFAPCKGLDAGTGGGAGGLARSTLSKIENGQILPTQEALKKLAGGLAISVPQLFTPPSKARVSGLMG